MKSVPISATRHEYQTASIEFVTPSLGRSVFQLPSQHRQFQKNSQFYMDEYHLFFTTQSHGFYPVSKTSGEIRSYLLFQTDLIKRS